MCFKWSVKNYYVAKILQEIWEGFLYKKNRNYNSCKFSYRFTFIPSLSFHKNLKQEPNCQQVSGLVTRNSLAFCLSRVVLYFRVKPNSIDFCKRIFYMLFLFVLSGRVLNTCLLPKEVREFAEEVDMIEKINLKNFQSHLNQKTLWQILTASQIQYCYSVEVFDKRGHNKID